MTISQASARGYVSPLVQCADPHASGFMCQKCARGFWSFGDSCKECPRIAQYSALSLMLWALLTFGFFGFLRHAMGHLSVSSVPRVPICPSVSSVCSLVSLVSRVYSL